MTQETSPTNVRGLTDAELLYGLKRLVGADRALGVKMLLHLGEVDARGLCLKQAYPSTHVLARPSSTAEAPGVEILPHAAALLAAPLGIRGRCHGDGDPRAPRPLRLR